MIKDKFFDLAYASRAIVNDDVFKAFNEYINAHMTTEYIYITTFVFVILMLLFIPKYLSKKAPPNEQEASFFWLKLISVVVIIILIFFLSKHIVNLHNLIHNQQDIALKFIKPFKIH